MSYYAHMTKPESNPAYRRGYSLELLECDNFNSARIMAKTTADDTGRVMGVFCDEITEGWKTLIANVHPGNKIVFVNDYADPERHL